jgi:hypothetical protein
MLADIQICLEPVPGTLAQCVTVTVRSILAIFKEVVGNTFLWLADPNINIHCTWQLCMLSEPMACAYRQLPVKIISSVIYTISDLFSEQFVFFTHSL